MAIVKDPSKYAEVKNYINYRGADGKPILDANGSPVIVTQTTSINTDAEHYFNFTGTFPIEDGGSVNKSILTVDKRKDGTYSLDIRDVGLFQTENAQSLASLLGMEGDGNGQNFPMDLQVPPSCMAIFKKGNATCFDITAKSGKTYSITVDGTSISIECEGKTFVHKAENHTSIDCDMHPDVIQAFLDKNDTFCSTRHQKEDKKTGETIVTDTGEPTRINDFPTNILAAYASLHQENRQEKFGNWTATTVQSPDSNQALFLMSKDLPAKKNSPAHKDNYLLFEGKFFKVNNLYFQHVKDEKTGKISYKMVVEVGVQNPKKEDTSLRSIAVDLETEGQSFTPETLDNIQRMKELCGYQEPATASAGSEALDGIIFQPKDERKYAQYRYDIRNQSQNHFVENGGGGGGNDIDITILYQLFIQLNVFSGNLDEFKNFLQINIIQQNITVVQYLINNNIIINEEKFNIYVTIIKNGGRIDEPFIPDELEPPPEREQNPSFEDIDDGFISDELEPPPEQEQNPPIEEVPLPEEEKKEKKKEEEKKEEKKKVEEPEPEKKNYDLSKPVDAFGTAFGFIGIFMMLGAMLLPGLGVLAAVGFFVALTGTTAAALNEKFKFTITKAAKKRCSELEKEDKEDGEFEENFMSKEKELDKAAANSRAKEKDLITYLEDAFGNESQLVDAYEKYGIGFSSELPKIADGHHLRTERLVSNDGLAIKRSMLASLQSVQSAKTPEARAEMIDSFVDTHFRPMPAEARQTLVDSLFSTANGTANASKLDQLITRLSETVTYEEKEKELYDSQCQAISTARDSKIERIMNSKSSSPERREKIVSRYTPTLIRRLASDKNASEEKLDRLLGKLPLEERKKIIEMLSNGSKQIEDNLTHVEAEAGKNRKRVAIASEKGSYVKVMQQIMADPESISSYQQATDAIDNLIIEKSCNYHQSPKNSERATRLNSLARSLYVTETESQTTIDLTKEALAETEELLKQGRSSETVKRQYEELKNLLFLDFKDLLHGETEGATSSGMMPSIEEFLQEGKIGSIEDLAAKFALEKDEQGNPTERSLKIKDALDRYKESCSKYEKQYAKQIESLLPDLTRILYIEEISSDPEKSSEYNDKKAEILNDPKIMAKIIADSRPVEDVNKRIAELSKHSFFKDNLSPEQQRLLAICSMIAEDAQKDRNKSSGSKRVFKNISNTINDIARGVITKSAIDRSTTLAISFSEKHTKDELNNSVSQAQKHVKGYRHGVSLIEDEFNFRITTPEGKQQTTRQELIEQFKNGTDDNAARILAGVLQNKFGRQKIEPQDEDFQGLLTSCTIDQKAISEKIKNTTSLTEDQKNSLYATLSSTFPEFDKTYYHSSSPYEYRRNTQTEKAYFETLFDSIPEKERKGLVKEFSSFLARRVDLEKAEQAVNAKIESLNARAQTEVHCHDRTLGESYAESEYRRHKKRLEQNKEDKTKLRYGNVYELIASLAVNSNPLTTPEEVEESMSAILIDNPKISPAKMAEKLGISGKAFKEGKKHLSTRGLSEEAQKQVWLKEKEIEDIKYDVEEFKLAWESALKGNTTALKHYLDLAKTAKEELAMRKKEGEELLKGKTGSAKKEQKTENKDLRSKKEKRTKEQNKITELRAKLLQKTGISLEGLDELLSGNNDPEFVKKALQDLNKQRSPIKKLEGIITDEENELDQLKLQSATLTESDRASMDIAHRADQFSHAKKEFEAKIIMLSGLERMGIPESIVEQAFEAFAKGDKQFFDKTTFQDKKLSDLLGEEFEFSKNDPALLKRLGIDPKDIMDSKKRKKKLEKIQADLKKIEQDNLKEMEQVEKKVHDSGKKVDADLSKKKPTEARDGLGLLAKLFGRKKEKINNDIQKQEEAQAKANAERDKAAEINSEFDASENNEVNESDMNSNNLEDWEAE